MAENFAPRTAVLWLVGLLLLGACAPSSPSEDESVYDSTDESVVADIMSTARTNFKTGDSITSRFGSGPRSI